MNKNFKEKLVKSLQDETPDIKEKVVEECFKHSQVAKERKGVFHRESVWSYVAVSISCLLIFVAGMFWGYMMPDRIDRVLQNKIVYLDVNPSIELVVDESDCVVSCTAINSNAQEVLEGANLVGIKIKNALNVIIEKLYLNGYLASQSDTLLISVNEDMQFLNEVIIETKQTLFEKNIDCTIIPQNIKNNKNLTDRAKQNGVSIGKMYFIDRILVEKSTFVNYGMQTLANMSVKELNLIYSN